MVYGLIRSLCNGVDVVQSLFNLFYYVIKLVMAPIPNTQESTVGPRQLEVSANSNQFSFPLIKILVKRTLIT